MVKSQSSFSLTRKTTSLILITLVIVLAAALRFFQLASYPVSLSWDEVAIGYNAYSIAQTGRDEYGRVLPILFQSFNDYKLPGYIYLDSIFVKIFGLSEFAVRFPSALLGTITVLLTYLLTRKLLPDWKLEIGNWKLEIAHFSALLFAISPWSIQLSRAAFETNAALFFILFGLTMFFYGFKKRILAILAFPILVLSIYFYYSPRLFVPIFTLVLVYLFKEEIKKKFKDYLMGVILAITLVIPITLQILTPQGFKRSYEVSIFADKSRVADYVQAASSSDISLSKIFLNRRIPIIFEGLHSYFSHFSFGFLFFGDDPNQRHKSAYHGNLYLFEIPLILTGLWLLFKYPQKKIKFLILSWLVIGPIAAGLTTETPHSLRALLMLPPLVTISAIGANYFWEFTKFRPVYIIICALFLINYLFTYYIVYPLKSSESWAYGYKQLFQNLRNLEPNYDTIIVTGHYWKPYIHYLFTNQIDPKIYQANPDQTAIGKYKFGVAGWDTGGQDLNPELIDKFKNGKTLVVLSPHELEAKDAKNRFSQIFEIKNYPQTQTIFQAGTWD